MLELRIDELTVILLVSVLALLAFALVLRPPSAQAHPILLGRQANASTVRNAGESAIWRSNQSVGRTVTLRPSPSCRSVGDMLVERSVREEATPLAVGLSREVKEGMVAVYTEDYQAAFTVVAAISLLKGYVPLLVPSGVSSSRLQTALSGVSAVFTSPSRLAEVASSNANIFLTSSQTGATHATLADLTEKGRGATLPKRETVDAESVFARALLVDEHDGVSEVEFTHTNLTAAVATVTQLFPMAGRMSERDTVASFFDPCEPVGLALAFAAAFSGAKLTLANAGFGAVDLIKTAKTAEPTVVFVPATVASSLAHVLRELATHDAAMPAHVDRAHVTKLARLRNGYVGPHMLWDILVYNAAKRNAGLTKIRALVLFSSLSSPSPLLPSTLDQLRAILGVPVMTGLTTDVVVAPLTASHPYDVQAQMGTTAHVGPPAPNASLKLIVEGGEAAASAGGGIPLVGELLVSGPSVARPIEGVKSEAWEEPRRSGSDDGQAWFRTGKRVELRTNGTFVPLLQ